MNDGNLWHDRKRLSYVVSSTNKSSTVICVIMITVEDFRYYIKISIRRNKFYSLNSNSVEITADYLQKLWNLQNGICPFTR